jgi:hypothetical protein
MRPTGPARDTVPRGAPPYRPALHCGGRERPEAKLFRQRIIWRYSLIWAEPSR